MESDSDRRKASLVREYLRQHTVEGWFAGEILRCLPTPDLLHPTLKKAILLRRLSADLSHGLLSEDTLQCLEVLEELDRSLGAAGPSGAMISAYCSVAAELTVAPLTMARRGGPPASQAGFLEMVDRVWKRRVEELERRDGRWMAGEGPRGWRRAIDEAVGSAGARDRLLRRDVRRDATRAVREYLGEAIEEMGPRLLDLVARAARGEEDGACAGEGAGQSGGERLARARAGSSQERCPRVSTGDPAEEMVRNASATPTEGGRRVPETETDKRNEPTGQTEGFDIAGWPSEDHLIILSSPEVDRVKEAPKCGCEELQKVVVDPLTHEPERSIHVVISTVETSAINLTDPCENEYQTGVIEPGSSVRKDVQGTEKNDDDVNHGGIPSPGLLQPDLMDTTANTYKGNEGSKECLPDKPTSSSKITPLPRREKRALSFKPQEFPKFLRGRKKKKWTPQEEDALRKAIEKHGKGNWKFILQSYPESFKDRTEVDLKDKWRNMTK